MKSMTDMTVEFDGLCNPIWADRDCSSHALLSVILRAMLAASDRYVVVFGCVDRFINGGIVRGSVGLIQELNNF